MNCLVCLVLYRMPPFADCLQMGGMSARIWVRQRCEWCEGVRLMRRGHATDRSRVGKEKAPS